MLGEKENWAQSPEIRFDTRLCGCGQAIVLYGLQTSQVDTEPMGQKRHKASGSRTALRRGWNGAWLGMNESALAVLGPVWRGMGKPQLASAGTYKGINEQCLP